jgi:hypothetical protein
LSREVRILRSAAEIDEIAGAWNRLPPGRGKQADLFDTHVWISAWLATATEAERLRFRVPVVFEGKIPRLLLPLIERRFGRWEIAGLGLRPRYRPILGTEDPDPEYFLALADGLDRAGVRELWMPMLPARDPATQALADALGTAGYTVSQRMGSSECLCLVTGNLDDHRKRFRKFNRAVRNNANKVKRLGEVSLETFGPDPVSVIDGFQVYLELHAKGWKGPLAEKVQGHRRTLLQQAGMLQWPRIYVLRISGVPAAAIIWFLIGETAIAYSTVYDQQMAALSPGSIAIWWAHEEVFQAADPLVFDYLPGHGPQKDKLGPDRSPLVQLEAIRSGRVFLQASRLTRRSGQALDAVGKLFHRWKNAVFLRARPVARQPRIRILPAGDASGVRPLEPDTRVQLFLAVAGGHRSVKIMAAQWDDADTWWAVGTAPQVLVRLGGETNGERFVWEIIRLTPEPEHPMDLLGSLAAHLQNRLVATLPPRHGGKGSEAGTQVHRAILPWPGDDETASE